MTAEAAELEDTGSGANGLKKVQADELERGGVWCGWERQDSREWCE